MESHIGSMFYLKSRRSCWNKTFIFYGKNSLLSQAWWRMHVILALGSPRQEDCQFGGQAELLSEYKLHIKIPSERENKTHRARRRCPRQTRGRPSSVLGHSSACVI